MRLSVSPARAANPPSPAVLVNDKVVLCASFHSSAVAGRCHAIAEIVLDRLEVRGEWIERGHGGWVGEGEAGSGWSKEAPGWMG